jgi:hypothetical protein
MYQAFAFLSGTGSLQTIVALCRSTPFRNILSRLLSEAGASGNIDTYRGARQLRAFQDPNPGFLLRNLNENAVQYLRFLPFYPEFIRLECLLLQ